MVEATPVKARGTVAASPAIEASEAEAVIAATVASAAVALVEVVLAAAESMVAAAETLVAVSKAASSIVSGRS